MKTTKSDLNLLETFLEEQEARDIYEAIFLCGEKKLYKQGTLLSQIARNVNSLTINQQNILMHSGPCLQNLSLKNGISTSNQPEFSLKGGSALMEAIHNYDIQTAKILIPFISNINEKNNEDYSSTAIQYAIECYHCMVDIDISALPFLLEIVELLLQKGADPDTVYHQEEWQGETLLMNACRENATDIIELLLKHNASTGKKSLRGDSALQITIEEKSDPNTALLLDAGAIEHIDPKRITPSTLNYLVRLASAYCSDKTLNQLVSLNADINAVEETRNSTLSAISSLLDNPATTPESIDTPSRMQLLIKMGANPFIKTPSGTYANGSKDPFDKYDKTTLYLVLLCDDFPYEQSPNHLRNRKDQIKKLIEFYLQLLQSLPSMHSLTLTCRKPLAFFKSQKSPILIAMYNHFPHFKSLQKTASKNNSSKEDHLKNFLSASPTVKMTEQKFKKNKIIVNKKNQLCPKAHKAALIYICTMHQQPCLTPNTALDY